MYNERTHSNNEIQSTRAHERKYTNITQLQCEGSFL